MRSEAVVEFAVFGATTLSMSCRNFVEIVCDWCTRLRSRVNDGVVPPIVWTYRTRFPLSGRAGVRYCPTAVMRGKVYTVYQFVPLSSDSSIDTSIVGFAPETAVTIKLNSAVPHGICGVIAAVVADEVMAAEAISPTVMLSGRTKSPAAAAFPDTVTAGVPEIDTAGVPEIDTAGVPEILTGIDFDTS